MNAIFPPAAKAPAPAPGVKNWEYFEYADDLLARRDANNPDLLHEVWYPAKACWERDFDGARFAFTAQKIDNPREYAARNPSAARAFATP